MIEANFTNYNIDLADIWDFERELFLNNQNSEEKASELIYKIQIEIIKKTEPLFDNSYADNNEDNCDYYKRNIDQYLKARNSIKTLFQIDFFFNNDKCYEYNSPIVIEKHNNDFDYWFALKLKQYQLKLIQLEHFLNFQLNENFERNKRFFDNFLTLIVHQYGNVFFNKNLIECIQDWNSNKNNSIPKNINTRLTDSRKMEGDFFSFKLKALNEEPNYLELNANSWIQAFKLLKSNIFIHSSTDWNQFKNIFCNKKIAPNKRIKWIGSKVELQWFIKELMYNSKKIMDLKNDIWLITISCFVDEDGNEYIYTQLKNATGKRYDRKDLLAEIVKLF